MSSVGAREERCVDGEETSVVAATEAVVWDVDDGTECRGATAGWFVTLCLLPTPALLPGDAGLGSRGEAGTLRGDGLPWLVTKIVVKLSSLLPLRDPE